MNKVFLIGNLTRDPEVTETSSGTTICRITLGVNRTYMQDGERKTDFINCTLWGANAENAGRYLHKGSKAAVVGSLEIRQWESDDGTRRTGVNINVQEVEFLTPRPAESNESKPNRKPSYKPNLQAFDDDDDIPF